MSLGNTLCQLAEQQSSLASQSPAIQHSNLIDEVQSRSADLAAAVSEAESQLEENQSLKQESQAFKGSVLLSSSATPFSIVMSFIIKAASVSTKRL